MVAKRPHIVLFQQDLRLDDNPALWHAASTEAPLILLYVLDETIGSTSKWWLYHSLKSLERSCGFPLYLRRGKREHIVEELVKKTGAEALFMSKGEPLSVSIPVHTYNSALLFELGEIKPYRIFAPFWHVYQRFEVEKPLPTPSFSGFAIKGDTLESWNLLSGQNFSKFWEPGEKGAWERVASFIKEGLAAYQNMRDFPAAHSTSLLSPHLHFGEIGPRQITYAIKNARKTSQEAFLRQLCWREFSYHTLYHFPNLVKQPLQEKFLHFSWNDDKKGLEAWKRGLTGYPIVDAGMRQLLKTGWMHNRVRMIVGSFLVKDLLIPWQEGERWFWERLVDADVASNAMNWQCVAGCGLDSTPFFHIFNPMTQGEKFDTEGLYVREWVPELGKLPNDYIHRPWEAPPEMLEKAGVILGKTYPYPIVDHAAARKEALNRFHALI